MAVGTITNKKRVSVANLRLTITDVVGSASYTAGGDTLNPSDLGMSSTVLWAEVSAPSGWRGQYDITNKKLMVFGDGANAGTTTTSSALPQAAAATNLSSVTFRVLALGN